MCVCVYYTATGASSVLHSKCVYDDCDYVITGLCSLLFVTNAIFVPVVVARGFSVYWCMH